MKLYRIVQNRARTADLSGTGAYRTGGRWNSKGTYMLYTSENSSLAYLENLVHFDKSLTPPHLFIIELELTDNSLIYTPPEKDYHPDWKKLSLIQNQQQGDEWMKVAKWLGIRLRSAINTQEYNVLLNPLYPRFYDLINIVEVKEIDVDSRLL